MKSSNVIKLKYLMMGALLLCVGVLSGQGSADITIGAISGPFSLDPVGGRPQAEYLPCWNPDGTQIAFSWGNGYTADGTNPDGSYIVIMTTDGQAIRGLDDPLVNHVGWDNHSPDWSPDGNWIVYAGSRVGPAYISKVSFIDGTTVPIPGLIGGHPKTPKWSPDGMKIAYRGGGWSGSPSYHICVTDPDGLMHEDLTPGMTGYGVYSISWSPDGKQIVFTQEGVLGLLVLDLTTKGITTLPGLPSDLIPYGVVWPEENSILFDYAGSIYDYQIDTQTTTQLTFGPGDYLGDWHFTSGLVFSSIRDSGARWDKDIYIAAPEPAIIPVPSSVVLCIAGLAFSGWKLRRQIVI